MKFQQRSLLSFAPSSDYSNALSIGRVLLVDDHESIRAMTMLYLQSQGYCVVYAERGDAAVQKATKERFDLIFMDINLPGLDGMEATRRIRAQGGAASMVPIIGMTASGHDQRRAAGMEAGMDDLIDKVDLLSVIPELIQRFVVRKAPDDCRDCASSSVANEFLKISELEQRLSLIELSEMTRLFAEFEADGLRRFNDLSQAWREGRASDAAFSAHCIAGGAATFQMTALRSILVDVETALRKYAAGPDGVEEAIPNLLNRLANVWMESFSAFKRWIDSKSG
ncbi:hypothetical protein CCP2SC5_1090003 [Azospirillaceae bacterium]